MNTSLKDLIEAAIVRHDGASGRALGKLAQDHGFRIVGTTINAIKNGTYRVQSPSDETLRAIAWLAGVPEAEAFTAAGKPTPGPPFAAELPPGVDNLSPRSRKAALAVLTALVHAEAGDHAHDQHSEDQQEPRPSEEDALNDGADRAADGDATQRSGAPIDAGGQELDPAQQSIAERRARLTDKQEDNIDELSRRRAQASAEGGQSAEQRANAERARETSVEEILKHAAYRPEGESE